MKVIVFIDVQNDFIDGALPADKNREVTARIAKYAYINKCESVPLIATRDTHNEKYLETFEGKNLPVVHCVVNTDGWQVAKELAEYIPADNLVGKNTFGSIDDLRYRIEEINGQLISVYGRQIDEIEICGFCTDICVISNALILRAAFPNKKIAILANLCAGTTKENHDAALAVAKCNQIEVRDAIV